MSPAEQTNQTKNALGITFVTAGPPKLRAKLNAIIAGMNMLMLRSSGDITADVSSLGTLARFRTPQNFSTSGGRASAAPEGALILSFTKPVGFVLPSGETRTPVFFTWGTVGMLIPDNIGTQVVYLNKASPATNYCGVQVGISKTAIGFVASATCISTTTLADFTGQSASFAADGTPPATYKILLGSAVVGSDGTFTLNNNEPLGGSIQITSDITGLDTTAASTLSSLLNYTQSLGWTRQ
jgi:hypothetical protein